MACALLWSSATVLFRKSGERVSPVALNFFKGAVALALFLITLPLIGVPFLPPERGSGDWAMLLVSGAIGIGVADSLFFAALNRLGAGGAALVNALYSPLVVLGAVLYLGDPVHAALLGALVLMVSAILLGTWEPHLPRTPAERRRTLAGVAYGTAAMLLMAVGFVMAKPVLNVGNPWWCTTVRLVGGMAVLGIQSLLPRYRAEVALAFRPSRFWGVTIPAAVLGSYIAMIVWLVGAKYTSASVASILNQTSTLFTVALGMIFLRERLTWRRGAAVGLALSGALIVVL